VLVVLTAALVVVWFDYLRKQRQQNPQRIKVGKGSPSQRYSRLFDASPLDNAPAKKLAAERPLEPLVAVATASRPPVQSRMERETVTVEMASPSPSTSFNATENPAGVLPAFTIDAELWDRMISSRPTQPMLSSALPSVGVYAMDEPEPIRKTSAPPTLGSANTVNATYQMIQEDAGDAVPTGNPGGVIQQPALEQLMQSQEPFTGLVVSIGINDTDSSMWHSRGLMQSVGNYIASLLRQNDFCCRTAYDEFVMVCVGEQGPQSQRRLNHISERLWDYQLRGIGACSILFSWGGVQIQDQPLAEGIASATERMRETKRSGQNSKSALAHRQAV
jgi:GGDEF domain-containing protein